MVSNLSSSSTSSTLSSSSMATVSTSMRHPLWQLDCKSCKTTLCEQAMLGHLAGDSTKKLFSTNLVVGGSECGYKLVQPCADCETNRGNGHFWIFYAEEVFSHWRRIRDDAIAKVSATTVATTPATTVSKKEITINDTSALPTPTSPESETDAGMAKFHWTSTEYEGKGEDEVVELGGRPMYWDDLPTWCQTDGNVVDSTQGVPRVPRVRLSVSLYSQE
ncbi:hypothetical protein BGX33_004902 [Mortierella sp. NVP41]|nr:hypothetical protein BGX33_004902 [Mortierella sp. NVP41]